MEILAILTLTTGGLSLLCLLILHFVSPEFQPSWRMVSECALGKHKPYLMAFFLLSGLSTLSSALLLWNVVDSGWATLGILFLSGIGAIMGGLDQHGQCHCFE